MKNKVLLKIIGVVIWIINVSWACACGLTAVIISVAVFKWATVNITEESYPLIASLYVIALFGAICKFAVKYWSDKGTNNGMELIKWNGKFPEFKKAEAKDE